jgi:hypothetical protein
MARMDTRIRTEEAETGATRWLNRLLDWLDGYAGDSYKDRWITSDSDGNPSEWCPALSTGSYTRLGARLSINALVLLGAIRPSEALAL